MSYAIIRNSNYKKDNLAGLYKHNERKNTNYSNKDIDRNRSINNYSIKNPHTTYWKALTNLIQKYNLKGRIIKTTNILCEYIVTSNKEFFDNIGEKETERFFYTAYKFVASYKNLGEDFIISAKIHMDESTPHMHLVFVPVIHKLDAKSGEFVHKIACSEFWKGKLSYKNLQDNFYTYMTRAGFELERGQTVENEHIPIQKLKVITNYELQELQKDSEHIETEIVTNNIEEMRIDYKRIIRKFNKLSRQYTRVKTLTDTIMCKQEQLQNENDTLKEEVNNLENECNRLQNFIDKTFECVSIMFNFPVDSLKRIVKNFVDKIKGN